nr:ATP-binding protein [Nostocaceae cyanobacterium]
FHYQPRLTDTDFTVSGRNYGMYIHNFRSYPLSEWLAQPPEWVLAVHPSQDHVSFSKSEFTIAVKQALQDFSHPEALSQNPLLNSRLVARHSPASDRLVAFQSLLQQTVELLQRSHRETKFYHALIHTYLHPAKSQEQAAEILDISIGSLRRHLKAGIIAVTEILWDHQINAQG